MKPVVIEYTPDAREDWHHLTPDQKDAFRRLIKVIKMRGWFSWGYSSKWRWLHYVASDEVRVRFRVIQHDEADTALLVAIDRVYTPPLEERD